MRRSIRWTLLYSYAITLALTLGLLGYELYRQQRDTTHEALDNELEAHGRAIAGAVEWDEHDGFELELDTSYLERFRQTGEDSPYFEVRAANGETLFSPAAGLVPAPAAMRQLPEPKQVVRVAGPNKTTVWVRQGTRRLERELAAFGRDVLLLCLLAFAAAMLGGWLLVGRVLAPIRRISATADRISAANPEERIDVARMEKELGSLATTLNEAFDRLQGAVDRQVQFTADASHELRTPLAVLRANVEWAGRGERTPEEYAEVLAACLRATDRMTRTVEDLLALARSDATELSLEKERVDLAALADETATFLAPLADEAEVVISAGGTATAIEGDASRLRDVLTGLVANALRHTPAGGRVEVQIAGADGQALLTVADSGPGIPASDLPHVFDRFYRADAARSGGSGGNGLGLAIARQVVEAHGGTIEAANRAEGGAVFTIRLPAAAC